MSLQFNVMRNGVKQPIKLESLKNCEHVIFKQRFCAEHVTRELPLPSVSSQL